MKTYLTTMKILVAVALSLVPFCSSAGQTSYYIYDESGHVIGEYDANGNPIQEHVYLGDRPVAVVTGGSSSGGTVDYVTTDQLNTPRVITDSRQTVLWSWNSDPFGNGQPTGSFTYNLRFPGQYYDAETGHDYNYFRDYESVTGRYIQSDPWGLKAGPNTYSYVRNNPIHSADRFGLCDTPDCKEVKNVCITNCAESTLPTRDFGFSFWRCVNKCMEAAGCGALSPQEEFSYMFSGGGSPPLFSEFPELPILEGVPIPIL